MLWRRGRLPCRWAAETIVVLDGDVTVGPPYTADAAKGKSAVSLAHVRKIVLPAFPVFRGVRSPLT